MNLRTWMVEREVCVCVFIHNERGILFGGIGGMSDVNDLIDEKTKLKMSDGICF